MRRRAALRLPRLRPHHHRRPRSTSELCRDTASAHRVGCRVSRIVAIALCERKKLDCRRVDGFLSCRSGNMALYWPRISHHSDGHAGRDGDCSNLRKASGFRLLALSGSVASASRISARIIIVGSCRSVRFSGCMDRLCDTPLRSSAMVAALLDRAGAIHCGRHRSFPILSCLPPGQGGSSCAG